jgi:hypothetical protein
VRSAQVLAVRALMLGSLLASGACFRPKLSSGSYACTENGPCPDGYSCENSSHLCVSSLGGASGTGGKGGTGGTGGAGNKDGGPLDMPPDRPCTGAIASCQPSDAGLCDPVCNTGCGHCFEKCSVNTAGALTCNAPTAGPSVGVFGQCAQVNSGADQTDNCAPGEFCFTNGECGSRCYQFCRTNTDCANDANCSRDAGGGHTFCDSPPVICNPVKGAASNGMFNGCVGPPNSLGCYLSSTSGRTICDCEFAGKRFLDDCTRSRDCLPGLVCYDPTGGTAPSAKCYPVCRLPLDGGVDPTNPNAGEAACNGIGNCLPFSSGGSVYGYCLNG